MAALSAKRGEIAESLSSIKQRINNEMLASNAERTKSMDEKKESCKDKVRGAYRDRMSEIRKLWNLYKKDPEARTKDGEQWTEYGLCFDYVAPGTFNDQKRGYFRYQISYGGPQEEFRFNADENLNMTSCAFWFLDWFDGASVPVIGRNRDTWREIWEDFRDCGTLEHAMKQAQS